MVCGAVAGPGKASGSAIFSLNPVLVLSNQRVPVSCAISSRTQECLPIPKFLKAKASPGPAFRTGKICIILGRNHFRFARCELGDLPVARALDIRD
jgi:hypothetical protein